MFEGAGAGGGRRGEGEGAVVVGPDGDHPGQAFLDDAFGVVGCAVVFEPGVGGSQGGVPGEGEFAAGGEDPQAVVGLVAGGGQDEGGLRQVGPARDPLHVLLAHAFGVDDDGQGVAPVGFGGEDVDLGEWAGAWHGCGLSVCGLYAGHCIAVGGRFDCLS